MNTLAPNPVLRSLTRTADFFTKLEHDLIDYVRAFRLGIQDGYELLRRYEALARLSPTELAKRGLTREGLMSAVPPNELGRPK